MTTNPSPENTAPEPAATRWSIGDIPPEPETGTAVRDRNDVTWTREATGWQRAGMLTFGGGRVWARLLIENGPLVRLVPADQRPERERPNLDSRRRDIVRAARRLLAKMAPWDEPSDAELGSELEDLRTAVAALDRHLMTDERATGRD